MIQDVNTPDRIPLLANYNPVDIFAWYKGRYVTQREYLQDVYRVLAQLGEWPSINFCNDRYLFAVGLGAALLSKSVTLLPPARVEGALTEILSEERVDHYLYDDFIPELIANDDSIKAINIAACIDQPLNVELPYQVPTILCNQPAVIAYTSGTTGKPAANTKQWQVLAGTAKLLDQRLLASLPQINNCHSHKVAAMVATVPPQHMYGLEMSVLITMQGRGVLVAEKPFYPFDIKRCCEGTDLPVCLVTTPVHMRAVEQSGTSISRVSLVVSATAPLNSNRAEAFTRQVNAPVKEIYGFTEAGSVATRETVLSDQWQMLDSMRLVRSSSGLEVSGSQLSNTVAVSDSLELTSFTTFSFIGRQQDMLNVGGKRGSLNGICEALLGVEGVVDAHVVLPHSASARPAALLVSERDPRAVAAALQEKLDPLFIPRPMVTVAEIPRSETGKVRHESVLALLNSEQQKESAQ